MNKDHFHIILPEGYKQALKILAVRKAVSMSGLIQQAIDEYLTKRSSRNGSEEIN